MDTPIMIKRTLKLKLPFGMEVDVKERRQKLNAYIALMVKSSPYKILEEAHYPFLSYLKIEREIILETMPQVPSVKVFISNITI